MGKKKDKLRRITRHSNRGSGGPSPSLTGSLTALGNDNNKSTSALGFLKSTSSSTSSLRDLTPSANVHMRPASALEHILPSSTTFADVTSPDPQQHTASSHTKTAWERAIEKLEPDDRKEFNFDDQDKRNTVAEVLQVARDKRQECENKKWSYKKANGEVVVLRVLADRLLTNLNKVVVIGDYALQHGLQTVLLAWSAFRFLLQISISDTEMMAHLLSDLEYISRTLARCEIYERIYNQTGLVSAQNLINMLPDLYASILIYLCHSKRYFGRNAAVRYAHSMVTSYTVQFRPLMDNVKNFENDVEVVAQTAAHEFQAAAVGRAEIINSEQRKEIADLQAILKSLRQENENKLQKICERLDDTERLEILKWLSEVKYGEHHDFIRSSREAETGNWLFEKPAFREWNTSAASAIFWLHGSLVVDTFKKRQPTNHALAYFYCKYGEIERQDPEFILRAIVQQLSIISPARSLPKPVVSLYQDRKKNAFNSGKLRLGESEELIAQLSKAFEQTVIVIDALDECNKETRGQLLEALKSLCSSTESLKIFVTSRNDDDILVELENEPELYIQSSDNSDDIKLFVCAEVERCISQKKLLRGSVKPELKQAIIDTLISGAGGMFLWVHLQIQHISRQKSESAVRAALGQLPKDLKSTYSVIWDRICDDTEENYLLAIRTLMWIICTQSPLTPGEIIEAVSIKPMQWAAEPNHDGITAMTLLDVCQNLLVIDNELGVFRSAHFSVTEFLQQKFKMAEAHTEAAEVCLTLLCCENHVNSSRQTGANIMDNYVLSNYVVEHWAEHVRLSGDGSGILTDLKKEFLEPSPAFHTWLREASAREYDFQVKDGERQLTPFWVVCWYQLWDMFEYALSSNADYRICNRWGKISIHLIASHGHDVGLKLLLEKDGVDWNCKDVDGNTPLHYAAQSGHEEVARLFLEQGIVDSNCKNNYGVTPLHYATRNGHEKVVQMLHEQESVDPNCKTNGGSTPLHSAALEGHEKVVQIFLEQEGMDSNCKCNSGDTPLHYAAQGGHEKVVLMLLEQESVDPNCKNHYGNTPLHYAARNGHEKVVQILSRQESMNPNCKNHYGNTPLREAAWNGHEKVVQMLLEQEGVDPNCKNCGGLTPLHEAAQNGHEKVVQMLLGQESVDPNCKNHYGNTPLHEAARNGHEKVVQMLLGHDGVGVNSKNIDGATPLHSAARNGHKAVVRLLKAPSVDLDSKDILENTPIHVATNNYHVEVVRVLEELQ